MDGREDTETELTAELILVLSKERAAFCSLSTLNPRKLTSSVPLCTATRGSCLGPRGTILPGPLPAPSSGESAIQGEEVANLE